MIEKHPWPAWIKEYLTGLSEEATIAEVNRALIERHLSTAAILLAQLPGSGSRDEIRNALMHTASQQRPVLGGKPHRSPSVGAAEDSATSHTFRLGGQTLTIHIDQSSDT